MTIKKCLRCEKEFESDSGRHKYCSRKCTSRNYYDKHRKELIRKTKEYDDKHPDQVRKRNIKKMRKYAKTESYRNSIKRNYEANRGKWKSRTMTYYMLTKSKYYKEHNILNKECKCGSVEDIEIHHKEYPINREDIIDAINRGKIYYMCRKCHKNKNTHSP